MPPRRFLAWPSRANLLRFLVLWLAVLVEFIVVFGGTDYLTAQHDWRLRLYADTELAIPLVPLMVVPYCSVYLAVMLAPFVLRKRRELDALAAALARVILIAGIAFLLLPAELGFPPVAATLSDSPRDIAPLWRELLVIADVVNLDYNLVPSLHVALLVTCLGPYGATAGRYTRWLLLAWALVVAAATVLTHQHHLLDAAAGLALGTFGAVCARRPSGK